MIVASLLLILVAVGLLVAGVLSGSNLLIVCTIAVVIVAAIVLVTGVRQSSASGEGYEDEPVDDATGEYPSVADNRFRVRQSGRRAPDVDEIMTPPPTNRRAAHASVGASAGVPMASAPPVTDAPDSLGETDDFGRVVIEEAPVRHAAAQGIPSQNPRDPDAFPPDYDEYRDVNAPAVDLPVVDADVPAAGFQAPPMEETEYDEDPPDEPSAQMTSPVDVARIRTLTTDVLVVDGRPRYHVRGCLHLHARPSEPLPVSEALELGFSPCGLCEPDSALLADARHV